MSTAAYAALELHTGTVADVPRFLTQARPTLLGTRSAHGAPRLQSVRERPADVFSCGQVVGGQYEITRVLGSGGMGQVFEANDRRLNRLVAIKASWPHLSRAPLRREAQVLAAFHHPGLVTVHAFGEDGGVEYLVMERLSGETLSKRLQRGVAGIEEATVLLAQVCESLAVLHQAGLAHADLKPANIMLTPSGRAVLLDLGIARIEQLRGDDAVSGSPHYIAPETIRGAVRPGEAHLVDLYALGVLAFVMLTGQPPFDHPETAEIMFQHLQKEPPRARSLRPEIGEPLEVLIDALLSKRPDDRPASVDEVRAALLPRRRLHD